MNLEPMFLFSIENSMEMILIFDEEGMIIYHNQSARDYLEYENGLNGIYISEIFPNKFQDIFIHNVSKNGSGEEFQDMMAYRRNRTCFPVKAKILKDMENPHSYICMAMDNSQNTFLEKRIAQVSREADAAAKVKSEFVANVTHELRTPVNGLLGNTRELMSMEADAKKMSILRMMERGCNDMNAIINNILDFSKLEAGKFTLEIRKFHFRDMMDYVKSNHINKITEKGLDFFLTISPEVPEYIIGDELRIVQILNNLISNACKFTAVGKIAVEVVKTAQVNNRAELFFMVIDSGIGIDKADQDKLFRSFSQVDASISRKYGGTGLGLNICKQLVELMDGSIRVESQRNKGTMFSVSIWVEIPQEELKNPSETVDVQSAIRQVQRLAGMEEEESVKQFGEEKNLEEIKKVLSKLILSVEMENWEKAETFVEAIRQLTQNAPPEIRSAALKLKMSVQKGDYEKTSAAFERIQELISSL